jgi:hypothetical protein
VSTLAVGIRLLLTKHTEFDTHFLLSHGHSQSGYSSLSSADEHGLDRAPVTLYNPLSFNTLEDVLYTVAIKWVNLLHPHCGNQKVSCICVPCNRFSFLFDKLCPRYFMVTRNSTRKCRQSFGVSHQGEEHDVNTVLPLGMVSLESDILQLRMTMEEAVERSKVLDNHVDRSTRIFMFDALKNLPSNESVTVSSASYAGFHSEASVVAQELNNDGRTVNEGLVFGPCIPGECSLDCPFAVAAESTRVDLVGF